jgi:hypothetical protein
MKGAKKARGEEEVIEKYLSRCQRILIKYKSLNIFH